MIRLNGMAFLALALTCAGAGFAASPVPPACQEEIALFPAASRAIHVEIADDEAERAQGLMNRTALADNSGMLFIFDAPREAAFWMKNTLIPLDMIFIRADGTIDRIAENRPPQDDTPTTSGGIVSAVLELPGGTAARLGLDESGVVRWSPPR